MKRKPGQSFEEYKEIRRKWNLAVKIFERGTLFYSPFANRDKYGKPTPYRNPAREWAKLPPYFKRWMYEGESV